MALSCIPKSVLSSANCLENPAGIGNYIYAVPLDSNHIESIVPSDEENKYIITPAGGADAALKGIRIEFKSQTGQYTNDDNGTSMGFSTQVTGRVEMNEDQMAHTSRILHNSDKYLYFAYTGKRVDGKQEFIVIGNEDGDTSWKVTGDSGTSRTDDHGQTFTAACPYQLYPTTKWVGTIEREDTDEVSSKGASSKGASSK